MSECRAEWTLIRRGAICTLLLAFVMPAVQAQTAEPAVTYTEHIAALINQHCLECHRPGMGTPFNFTNYEEVSKKARLIAQVTQTGFMPPWKAERGHTPLQGERGLSPAEIGLFEAWNAQGRPEGDPALLPEAPQFPEGWRLGIPDLVVEMKESYAVPADGPDIYRNFVLDLPELPEGTWVRGIEFQPGAPAVVHHSLFDLDTTGVARRMDAYDEGPGFGGMEQRFSDQRIGGYAVGALPTFFPEGVAISIPKGADLVMETHFHPSGKAESERSRVGLFLTKEAPTRELIGLPVPAMFGLTTGLDIPAGESRYVVEHTYTMPYDVDAVKISPHAHYICTEISSVAHFPDGTEQTLISVKDWDFAWQEQYLFEEPVRLPKGTELKMTFVYDNSAQNPRNPHNPPQRIPWGPQSSDEMAGCGLSVIPVNPGDGPLIRQALADYRLKEFENVEVEVLRPIILGELLERFDKDGDGKIGWRERLGMIQFWRATQAGAPETAATAVQRVIVQRVFGDYFETIRARILWGGAAIVSVISALALLILRRLLQKRAKRRTALAA